jgi:hypothetical protein
MNCKNFEAVISDLAREQMLEAHARGEALSHVEECIECARMLEDERALTRGLRSLAASMEKWEAPAALEASLVAKFRERKAAAAEQVQPVVVQMPQRASAWKRWYPHAVAAAVLLMFAVGGAGMLRMRYADHPASRTGVAATSDGNKGAREAATASSDATKDVQSVTDEGGSQVVAANGDDTNSEGGRKLSKDEVAAIMNPGPARRTTQRVPKSAIDRSVQTPTSGEIATEFMPVSYGDNLNEIDNGRIVRVEMPRSALAQFGIPVNMERANERIKADVLIGDDGMARAIRFVR